MPGPAICAIIPLYNGAAFIETALVSVLNQTLAPTEIIVVDDGSTDDGLKIVQAFAAGRENIRILHKANGGQSSARNMGAAACACDFIAFLDQDDAWYPRHLDLLHRPFQDDPDDLLGFTYGNLDEVDLNGRMVNMSVLDQLPTTNPKRSVYECVRRDMFVLPGASLVRRDVFAKLGGFDERLVGYEDDDFFLRVFEDGWRNVFVDEPVTRWRIHTASTSYSSKMQVSRMIYARKLIGKYPDAPALARFYVRDAIAPRFMGVLKSSYLDALRSGRDAAARSAAEDLLEFAPHLGRTGRIKLELLLSLRHAPRLARLLFRMSVLRRIVVRLQALTV